MSHISGEIIDKLARVVQALDDAALTNGSPLYVRIITETKVEYLPLILVDDEADDDSEQIMTVGDLREILRPFAMWF